MHRADMDAGNTPSLSSEGSSGASTPNRPKKIIRVARSENMIDTERSSTRIHRKQPHTQSVRDLPEAIVPRVENKVRKGSASPRRGTSPASRSRLPSISRDAVEAVIPIVALTLAFGAFIFATLTLSNPNTIYPEDM